jgi:hypothetical protein
MKLEDLIKERSYTYLVEWLRYAAMPRIREPVDKSQRARAVDAVIACYGQINEILHFALDLGDVPTFDTLLREWNQTLRDDYDPRIEETAALARLREEQGRLLLGIVMWAAHKIDREASDASAVGLYQMFQSAAGQFDSPDQVRRALISADINDSPWATWFLSELPSGEAHFIPTRNELRRAALLLTLRLNVSDPSGVPFAPATLLYEYDDLKRILDSVEEMSNKWAAALAFGGEPAPSSVQQSESSIPPLERSSPSEELHRRASRLLEALDQSRRLAQDNRKEEVRLADLNSEKVQEFRSATLGAHREARIFADLIAAAGAREEMTDGESLPPDLHQRQWLPKEWFISDTNVVGINMAARDLAQGSRSEEQRQLLNLLPHGDPVEFDGPPSTFVHQASGLLRQVGFEATLVLMPLNWQFARELTGDTRKSADLGTHVPANRVRDFHGLADGVPILDRPGLVDDKFFVLDLGRLARLEEWPSDERSGVLFSLQGFSEAGARDLLDRRPEVRDHELSESEAILKIQEQLLLDLTLRWRIAPANTAAAIAIAIPAPFRRGSGQ